MNLNLNHDAGCLILNGALMTLTRGRKGELLPCLKNFKIGQGGKRVLLELYILYINDIKILSYILKYKRDKMLEFDANSNEIVLFLKKPVKQNADLNKCVDEFLEGVVKNKERK